MLRPILFFLILIFAVFLLFCHLQKKNIFFPSKNIEASPEDFNLPSEDVYIKTGDNLRLNGWFIPNEESGIVLLFFHGNGGNISHRLHKASQLYKLGLNIFLVDYRGYGRSQGRPSVPGIYKDALAAFNYLVWERNIDPRRIVLYGESLGSALAVNLASLYQVGGIILEGAFSSGKEMGRLLYSWMPSFLLPDIFDNVNSIKNVDEPKLFIHSKNDEIVPLKLAKRLYQAAGGPKEFSEIAGGHNTAYIDSQDEYSAAVAGFINRIKGNREQKQ